MTPHRALSTMLLAGIVASGCGGPAAAPDPVTAQPQPGDGRLVLVSGRDDHGMVALRRVPVYEEPEAGHVAAKIVDGTLARVVEIEGQWLRVETVEGPRLAGWVNDFYLRGEARLVGPPPSCAVRVDGSRRDGGTLVVVRELRDDRVLVETVTPPSARGWSPRADLQELPPQGNRCGDIPPEDRHAH
ncbi:MAG: hypothetical protein ACSLEW_04745 [Nocardioides sp.]